jgi:hypothetical protein
MGDVVPNPPLPAKQAWQSTSDKRRRVRVRLDTPDLMTRSETDLDVEPCLVAIIVDALWKLGKTAAKGRARALGSPARGSE